MGGGEAILRNLLDGLNIEGRRAEDGRRERQFSDGCAD